MSSIYILNYIFTVKMIRHANYCESHPKNGFILRSINFLIQFHDLNIYFLNFNIQRNKFVYWVMLQTVRNISSIKFIYFPVSKTICF